MTKTIEPARLRQGLYRYFGGALLSPDHQRVAALVAASEFIDGAGVDRYAFYGPWAQFAAVVTDASAADLSMEYVRLFASGVDGALCPPIESFYRSEAKGGGIARVISRVERAYREVGLAAFGGFASPDHAAVELEAMSALCSREAADREAGNLEGVVAALKSENRFLRRHLAVWFPEFRARVAGIGDADAFYATLVEATHAFIVHELDLIGLLTREIVEAPA